MKKFFYKPILVTLSMTKMKFSPADLTEEMMTNPNPSAAFLCITNSNGFTAGLLLMEFGDDLGRAPLAKYANRLSPKN